MPTTPSPPAHEPCRVGAADERDALSVLVLARAFPSRTQPWLLHQLEQIVARGGRVMIAADHGARTGYPEAVDRLGLRERTVYLPVRGMGALRGILRLALPGAAGARAARRGVSRLLRQAHWRPEGLRDWWRACLKAELLAAGSLDLVHSHSLFAAYDSLSVPAVLRIPLVLTFHGLHPHGVSVLEARKRAVVFGAAEAVLVNTQFAASEVESLGCPRHKVRILPQGIPLTRFPFAPRPAPPADAPVRLLTVGRLQPDKGIRYAIEAIRILLDQGRRVEYEVVGGGPERAALEQLAARCGVAHAVRFLGTVDDQRLRAAYAEAHVFVLPSVRSDDGHHTETQGVVLQEAQASGTLVVATRVGGIPECVEDGDSAFLVPDRDPAALAARLDWVMGHPDRWADWQRRGRAWVEERFDIDHVGARLWQVYREVRQHWTGRSRP